MKDKDGSYGPKGLNHLPKDPMSGVMPSPFSVMRETAEPHIHRDNDEMRKEQNRYKHSSYRK